MNAPEWMVSLHGGHSSDYCDHAKDPLCAMVEAAVAKGFSTYGLSEHAPRVEARFLYPDEVAMGWDVAKIEADFDAYARRTAELVDEYADRLCLLRGFESEVVPSDRYVDLMLGYRERYAFDYMVGSVHFIDDFLFDYGQASFDQYVEIQGGFERALVRYYEEVAEMVAALRPEIVGHFDLIRQYAAARGAVDTPAIRSAAEGALDVVRDEGGILDLNTVAIRKGLGDPYPESWVVHLARERGIPFCFGDDSHCAADVGAGVEEGRAYLLEHGIESITCLDRRDGTVGRREIALA
ncbi:MAG: histidinol-phosphatase [bacterium]|nr:histidinol-phosphatase [bacterium]